MSGTYESAPWEGPFLDFPAGRSYLFIHGLGSAPQTVSVYFSFDDVGGSSTPAAGNQATIEEVTAEHVHVRNDTCSHVYVRVTASDPL